MKTAIARYLARSDLSSDDYIEVIDSQSVMQFCSRHLSSPSSRSGIQTRVFTDIKPEVFVQRRDHPLAHPTTLAGINKVFQYVCEVLHTILLQFLQMLITGQWHY